MRYPFLDDRTVIAGDEHRPMLIYSRNSTAMQITIQFGSVPIEVVQSRLRMNDMMGRFQAVLLGTDRMPVPSQRVTVPRGLMNNKGGMFFERSVILLICFWIWLLLN